MMAAFADAAPAWAAAGIVPLPVSPTGKGWMVKHPETFRRPAAMALAAKPRFAAANLGFMCGSHNRLTVVDVDSKVDAELQHALETYGDSPIIVSTPSGGHHVYYAHNDEPRKVRPDAGHPIDMLGDGLCVAPPSTRPSGASYAWQRGSLADIANGNLPRIRNGAVGRDNPRVNPHAGPRVPIGQRNAQLFRYCRQIVGYCDDLDALTDAARTWADSKCAEPMPEAEVVKTAASVWKYQGGKRRVMQNIVEAPFYSALIANLDALALYSYLSAENGPAAEFMVADGLGPARNWPQRFVPKARKALLAMGAIKCVRFPRKGVPALYRWNLAPLSQPMRGGGGDIGLPIGIDRSFGGLS
jgi:Bifunctional DNA primase/polymerase, N-terminal/Primase C terminal 1 (PriCT-1)